MKSIFCILLFFFFATNGVTGKIIQDNRKDCDVVFCIDMSGSAEGIFEAFTKSYWKMINAVKEKAVSQHIRVGLIGYSRESFKRDSNYVRIFYQPTDNFEQVFLGFCKINPHLPGGTQMMGSVIETATKGIAWSRKNGATHSIIVIGNGRLNGGPVTLKTAVKYARKRGVVVQPVFIMSKIYDRELSDWEKFAGLCSQNLVSVKFGKDTVSGDRSIDELRIANIDFNDKIIFYGDKGKMYFEEMAEADAQTPDDGLYERLSYKLFEVQQPFAQNWNLVSLYNSSGFELASIDRQTLPLKYTTLVGDSMISILKNQQQSQKLEIRNLEAKIELIKPKPIDYAPADDKSMRFDAAMILAFKYAVSR